jgi:hypothetical protein
MATIKINRKTTFPTDRVAEILQKALDRWKAKSPKAARIATDVLFYAGSAALLTSIIPLPIPQWVMGITFITGSVLTKLTKE